jgi:hypothetical protein
MAYLYRHIRKDKDQVFYIGIGTDDNGKYSRAKSKNRNKYWHRIVNNTDYEIEIMLDDITFNEALEKEKEFIQVYGRRDLGLGTLCNLTDGGEGVSNMSKEGKRKLRELRLNTKMPEEQKERYSKMFKRGGNPNSSKIIHKHTLEVFESILDASEKYGINKRTLGNNLNGKNCNHSDFFYYKDYLEKGIERLEKERLDKIFFTKQEFKRKRSEKVVSEETRAKLSKASKGRKISEHVKLILKEKNKGENNPISKKVINIKTKEVFNTIKEAADSVGKTRAWLSSIFRGKIKNKTDFMLLDEYNKKEGLPPLS